MRGTLMRHPTNGRLVYSPDTWVDPAYAINHPNGRFAFCGASNSQIARFPTTPEHPGEFVELRGEPERMRNGLVSLPPFP